jgi:outer membrane protein assembly factor BamB
VAPSGCRRPLEREFEYSSDGPSRTGLLAVPDGVVLGNESGAVVRVATDGRPRWRMALAREVAARPVVAGEVLVAATLGGDWYGLDVETGAERWRRTGQPAVLTPLCTDGAAAVLVARDGAVRAIDAATGADLWARPPPPGGPREAAAEDSAFPAPLFTGARYLVALGDAGLWALDPSSGQPVWRHAGGASGLAASAGRAFTASRRGPVTAVDLATGRTVWSVRPAALPTAGPWLAGDAVWVGVEGNVLVELDPADGRERSSRTLPAPASGVVAHRHLLLVGTSGLEGRLLAFRPGVTAPALSVPLDSPLRAPPLLMGGQILVLASDGRLLGFRARSDRR